MNHLTDEQIEDILKNTIAEPVHVSECEHCRKLLAEKRAMADRLGNAFAAIKPDQKLAEKIRTQIANKAAAEHIHQTERFRYFSLKKVVWPAAAAIILIAVLLGTDVIVPPPANAAPAEFVKIHQHNLSDEHPFYSESDPEKLAAYFKEQLGFSPSMPVLGQGMKIRGCCVRHFQGQIAGSYVVDTPQGVISVIVVTDEPQTLGMSSLFEYQGKTFYHSTFAKCNLAAVRIGNYTYCAVGEISSDYLTDLLSRLVTKPSLQPQES